MNVWCDVCGVQGVSACQGEDTAVVYEDTIISSGDCGYDASTGNKADNASYTIYDTNDDGSGDKMVISGEGPTMNYDWDSSLLKENDNASTVTVVVIDEGITTIGERLLFNLTSLKTLYIPNTLNTICTVGIANCTSLTDIVFSDKPSLSTLEENAFSGCTSLNDNELLQLSSLTTLGMRALENTAYAPVILPPSVTSVNQYVIGDGDASERILYMPQNVIPDSCYAGIVLGYELDIDKKKPPLLLCIVIM